MREYSDQVMAYREGAAPSRIFYSWLAAAFSLIIFVSTGIRFAVGPFLKPVLDDLGLGRGSFSLVLTGTLTSLWEFALYYGVLAALGLAFAVSCGLLRLGAGLSLTINVAGRPRARSLLQPVAGGR